MDGKEAFDPPAFWVTFELPRTLASKVMFHLSSEWLEDVTCQIFYVTRL